MDLRGMIDRDPCVGGRGLDLVEETQLHLCGLRVIDITARIERRRIGA